MILRAATLADAGLLLAWRNDPQTREAARSSEIIDQADHLAWLKAVLKDPDRTLLIAMVADVPVGTVRLDDQPGVTELSWTVGGEHRQKGYGKQIVALAVNKVAGSIRAVIRRPNTASQKVAAAAGLTMVDEDGDLTIWARS